VKLFKGDLFILEWTRPLLLFFRSVNIRYQDLPYPIVSVYHKGLFGFQLEYKIDTILVKNRPFYRTGYFIYYNDKKIAEVTYPMKLMLGYRESILTTTVDDEEVNLYVVLSYLVQMAPLT
jgi:hypothetical protein